MKKNTKIFYIIVLIALLAVVGIAYYMMRPKLTTDGQKRAQILKLYMGYKKEFSEVQDVSPREAMHLFDTGKVVFIDVREPDEQSVSRLPGAIAADIFLDNTKKYNDYIKIGYCTISYRSGVLAQGLNQKGIPIYNLRGGLLAWVHDGGKVYNGTEETHRIHVYGQEWNLGPEGYEAIW
jgi:rhodanese-related sulfurtransferase